MFNGDWGNNSEGVTGTIFRDLITILFMIAMVFVILLIINQNPDKSKEEQDRRRGNIRIEIIWPKELSLDFDLWMQAPDQDAVGFTNKVGQSYSLVRDDLGTFADMSKLNYEVGFSRGMPVGEHIINLHWYADRATLALNDDPDAPEEEYVPTPDVVPVRCIVSLMKNENGQEGTVRNIFQTVVMMSFVGEEQTIVGFMLDENGDVVSDSMHSIYNPIVGSRKIGSERDRL